MIQGKVQNRRASVALTVYGTGSEETGIGFVVDTGFTGVITLPPRVCSILGLPYIRPQLAGLADGSPVFLDVHEAILLWDNNERFVEALAMDGEPLIGMMLLDGHDSRMSVRNNGFFTIEQSSEGD